MLDLVRLFIRAGDGGNGKVSFWRNKSVLKGGPDGGDGGDGGDVVIEVDENLNTLQNFSGIKRIEAKNGDLGGRARKVGKKGENEVIYVPRGTVIWLFSENVISATRRERYGLHQEMKRDDVEREKYYLEKETGNPPGREGDNLDGKERPKFNDFLHLRVNEEDEYQPLTPGKLLRLTTMDEENPRLVLCQGGFGGRGNDAFKSSTKTTPLEAEYGTFGEQKMVFLELQLLANVGLVGLPNAGKSSLLARLTKAQPKIANYPFTTLEPNLGVMTWGREHSLVLADIPGLIEGASEGKGLGYTFLRHVQNCRELVYVVSLSEGEVFDTQVSEEQKARRLRETYQTLKREIGEYSGDLLVKKQLVVVNKADLYEEKLRAAIKSEFGKEKVGVLLVSAATGEGLEELREKLIG